MTQKCLRAAVGLLVCGLLGACTGADPTTPEPELLAGELRIGGSSSVFLISDVLGHWFAREHPAVWVQVDHSGSGEGLNGLLEGRYELAGMSRELGPADRERARAAGVELVAHAVASDAVAVVVDVATGVQDLTPKELQRLWSADSDIARWSDLRPELADLEVRRFAPRVGNGTRQVMVASALAGGEHAACEEFDDDSKLLAAIGGSPGGVGYAGLALVADLPPGLRRVAVTESAGGAPAAPTVENVASGAYETLARELFLVTTTANLERQEVSAFVQFYLSSAPRLIADLGFVKPLGQDVARP